MNSLLVRVLLYMSNQTKHEKIDPRISDNLHSVHEELTIT